MEMYEDGVRIEKPEYAHFFPALAVGLGKRLLGAAINAFSAPAESEEEEEEYDGLEIEVDEDDEGYDISLPILSDERAEKVAAALNAELDRHEDESHAMMDVLDDALDRNDRPEFAHFKKKLKKLKKLKGKLKKGLGSLGKLTGKLGPLGSLVPGLGAVTAASQFLNDSANLGR